MHSIASARAWAARQFRQSGVDAPALASDLLLGFALGRDRVYILAHAAEGVPDAAWRLYGSLVRRHAGGEPLQYLIGEREFFGLDFSVTPAVLIPRPETEILVEAALRLAPGPDMRYADVGTGSGCVAVSVACRLPASSGWATDISGAALEVACANAARHGVLGRVRFIRADLLECFRPGPLFDMILSNPPYVALEDYDTLSSGVRDHEPRGALVGGRDGLDCYRRLGPGAAPRLAPGGRLLLEVGRGQAGRVRRLMEGAGLAAEEAIGDLQGIPRCLVFRKE